MLWNMMNNRKEFLSVFQILPARMFAEEAAWYLGFAPHDIPILVGAGLLKPLGRPASNGTKYFATATLQELRADVKWLSTHTNRLVGW
jgi:hypothetical protein